MSAALWLGLIVGAAAGVIVVVADRVGALISAKPSELASSGSISFLERVVFSLWALSFAILPFLIISSGGRARTIHEDGLMWGRVAISWLVLGGLPWAIATVSGSQVHSAFVSRLKLHSKSKPQGLAVIWIVGIALLAYMSLSRLLT